MATRVLIDTNIFLEVLLEQQRWKLCEDVLREHNGESALTDFSLHSIGVVLLGQQKATILQSFCDDVLLRNELLTAPPALFPAMIRIHRKHRLGFDDAYQLTVAEHFGLDLITIDRHFLNIDSSTKITVLD